MLSQSPLDDAMLPGVTAGGRRCCGRSGVETRLSVDLAASAAAPAAVLLDRDRDWCPLEARRSCDGRETAVAVLLELVRRFEGRGRRPSSSLPPLPDVSSSNPSGGDSESPIVVMPSPNVGFREDPLALPTRFNPCDPGWFGLRWC